LLITKHSGEFELAGTSGKITQMDLLSVRVGAHDHKVLPIADGLPELYRTAGACQPQAVQQFVCVPAATTLPLGTEGLLPSTDG